MKKMMIAVLVTLATTVSHAQDRASFCSTQAAQVQKTLSEINELALNGEINQGEYSVLIEMLNNTVKANALACSQR